jgi:hypothetical protein
MTDEKKYPRGENPNSAAARFKSGGRSPNPGGRPPGAKNRQKVISEFLDQLVTANLDGKRKKISIAKGALLKLSQLALNGDRNAIKDILSLWKENDEAMRADLESLYHFEDADHQVIEAVYARMQACEEPNGS